MAKAEFKMISINFEISSITEKSLNKGKDACGLQNASLLFSSWNLFSQNIGKFLNVC